MRRLLALIVAITFAPLAAMAADYEIRITYDASSKKMRHGMMKHFAGTYEFSNRSDLKTAESAHEEFIDRLNTFDRDYLETTKEPNSSSMRDSSLGWHDAGKRQKS